MTDNPSQQPTAGRPNEPRGGSIIADRYQVDRLIARGGMAAVYLAQHIKLNRAIALKILSPPPDAEDPSSFEERFRLEAETLAQLDHPNIVTLHDYGETEDGRFFLAMEYVEGPRLSDLLREGPLPVDRALRLIIQVCAGLRYSHKKGVVHRDLKPSNLLIRTREDGEEQVKVVDFGLVKLTEADQSITRAGLILGSPHCMAPEQVKGLRVDVRTDIYAVGILLFRSLTGQYPFHGPNSAATMIGRPRMEPELSSSSVTIVSRNSESSSCLKESGAVGSVITRVRRAVSSTPSSRSKLQDRFCCAIRLRCSLLASFETAPCSPCSW